MHFYGYHYNLHHSWQFNLTVFNKCLCRYKIRACRRLCTGSVLHQYVDISVDCYLSALQSPDEGAALAGAGTHRLSPALAEQTGHRRFVGQRECASILDMGKEQEQKNIIVSVKSTFWLFNLCNGEKNWKNTWGKKKGKKSCAVFSLRPSVSFCSVSAKNFHFGAFLILTCFNTMLACC